LRQLNILVTPHGEVLAHTTRALMIAEELRSRGANVAFAMRGDKTAIVKAAGFPVHDIVGVPLHNVLRRLREGNPKLSSSSQAAECVTADIDILKRERPDIVLSDFRPSMPAAARITKTPHVSVLNATWTPFLDQERVRLIWPGHTRFGAWAGKLARALSGPDLMRFRDLMQSSSGSSGTCSATLCSRSTSFRPCTGFHDAPISSTTGSAISRSFRTYPSFMPMRADAPDSVKMIGPLVWKSGNFSEVEALKSKLDRSRPTLYATVGSTGDPGLFSVMIDAARRKHWNLIITKAGLIDIPSSQNVFVYDFLPGEAVMRLADVTICQGGSGTVNQAIVANCPFVGVACNADQEWNLDRASRLGIAKVFYGERVDPNKLVAAIEEILAQKELYRARFAIFDDDKRNYLGAKTAVDAIESALDDRLLQVRSD
jgi:UDP:flavonoid glycosyltransferase YjiC (YdhE family)